MYTDDYMTYLKKEKRMSENTRAAYGRDLAEFVAFEGARDGEHQVAKDRA